QERPSHVPRNRRSREGNPCRSVRALHDKASIIDERWKKRLLTSFRRKTSVCSICPDEEKDGSFQRGISGTCPRFFSRPPAKLLEGRRDITPSEEDRGRGRAEWPGSGPRPAHAGNTEGTRLRREGDRRIAHGWRDLTRGDRRL